METIDMLTCFGLTRQEAAIYTSLYREGALTGYEAAKSTGASRSNAYTALAGLVDKGAAYSMEDGATRYTAVPIDEFCGNKLSRLSALAKALVAAMPGEAAPQEGYITIRGREHIFDKLCNMICGAGQRIYISAARAILEYAAGSLAGAIRRNLKVVVITNPPFALDGAQIYHGHKSPGQLRLIVDSRAALTGDALDESSSCLYSTKQNLVDLVKEALRNEIDLINSKNS